MFVNYKQYTKGATLQYHKSKNNFNYDKMVQALDDILEIYVPEFPEAVKLNLPKLNLPKLNKIENV